MIGIFKKYKYLIIIAIIAFMLYCYFTCDRMNEPFVQMKQIRLNDATDGMDTGYMYLETTQERTGVTLEANLPFIRGGDYNMVDGLYHAYMVKNNGEKYYLGSPQRETDGYSRLRTYIPSNLFRQFTDVIVVRKTLGYTPVVVLKGSIMEQTDKLFPNAISGCNFGCRNQGLVFSTMPY